MAKPKKKTTTTKKKKWISILAPNNWGVLGETYVDDPQKVVGKCLKVNLMNLINDPKKRRYNVSFRVDSLEGTEAKSSVYGYNISPNAVKTMIKKNRDRIDHRIVTTTKDEKIVIIKPLIITRGNTAHAVHTAIRAKVDEHLTKVVNESDFDNLIMSAIQMKVQRELKKELGKIHPVGTCELRVITLKK